MATVYSEGIVVGEADSGLGTVTVTATDGAGDLAQFIAATGGAGASAIVASKFGCQLLVNGLSAALKFLDGNYVAPTRAAINSAGTVGEGRRFRGPAAEATLVWKSGDNGSTVLADPAAGRVRCVFVTSAATGIVATGAAGSGVLEFSDATIAAQVASALQEACDRVPYENRVSD